MVATVSKPQTLTLEEFLALPETKPASEYQSGIIRQKPLPRGKHSIIQGELVPAINQQAKPKKIAYALPELRCTFAGRSIVPDIAVLRWANLPQDEDGEISNEVNCPPDWIIEILSPDQSATLVMEKIIFCLAQGTELGWLIDPQAKSILTLNAGLPTIHLADNTAPLKVPKDLAAWQITTPEIFGWLQL
ncbi:MAG: Uma2 family endonuclease [Cyanobacteria bacterium P01_G01_bin.54]